MNIVYIGEAGSGKTELAINTAVYLAHLRPGKVALVDLDQTKAMFRLREKAQVPDAQSISFKWGEQLLDTPVTPSGIRELIAAPKIDCIIDVGGNAVGAVQLGQFSMALEASGSQVYYCINPYRPFTDAESLRQRIAKVQAAARVQHIRFVCNPNFGDDTTYSDILSGVKALSETLSELGCSITAVAVAEEFSDRVREDIPYEVFPLKRYMLM